MHGNYPREIRLTRSQVWSIARRLPEQLFEHFCNLDLAELCSILSCFLLHSFRNCLSCSCLLRPWGYLIASIFRIVCAALLRPSTSKHTLASSTAISDARRLQFLDTKWHAWACAPPKQQPFIVGGSANTLYLVVPK